VRRGGWVVARGFDDALASPPRLLARAELDMVLPETPVRLRHRTGHASLLNSAALGALPPLPASASLALDQSEQAVLLVGAESWLDSITGHPERAELVRGLRQADVELGRVHIARVWDASPRSEAAQACLLELVAEAGFSPQLRLMASPEAAESSPHASAVKVFASHPVDLTAVVGSAHRSGLPVAIHATEPWEIEAAVTAIERCTMPDLTDRIEHATLISRIQAERLAAVGSVVVANPGWIVSRREKYQAQLRDDQRLHVMPLATLLRTGCSLAFGSDAPVDRPDPGHWMRAAVGRLGPERITTEQALEAAIGAAAWRATRL